MTYADNLQRPADALLRHGGQQRASDEHRCSSFRRCSAPGKSFEVQVGPDQGHSGLNQQRMMEFFIENLVLTPAGPKA